MAYPLVCVHLKSELRMHFYQGFLHCIMSSKSFCVYIIQINKKINGVIIQSYFSQKVTDNVPFLNSCQNKNFSGFGIYFIFALNITPNFQDKIMKGQGSLSHILGPIIRIRNKKLLTSTHSGKS